VSRPICVECLREMRCAKNGVSVNGEVKHHHRSGDLYQCPVCQKKVIIGLSEGYESEMQANYTIIEGSQ